jgi:hypothetical protein
MVDDWLEPSDPPEDDDPLAAVAAAIGLLADKLRQEPELAKAEALLLLKLTLPECSIHFQSLIWPQARRMAGLPIVKSIGRPKKHVPYPNPLDLA